jgi:hypothetical protein
MNLAGDTWQVSLFRTELLCFLRITAGAGVEMGVSVVDGAKEDREDLFRLGEAWAMFGLGHLSLLGEGRLWLPTFYLVPNPRNTDLVVRVAEGRHNDCAGRR